MVEAEIHRLRRDTKHIGRLEERTRRIIAMNTGRELNKSFSQLGYKNKGQYINENEFSLFSQNGEDGIILSIFLVIGVTDRQFVEISPGSFQECNTANLAVNFGWSGLIVDSSEVNMKIAREFLRGMLVAEADRVKTRTAIVTAENVNDLIEEAGMSGEIDLLSLDIDGNDYWVWSAIRVISPRVVVCEFNPSLGRRPATIAYDPSFVRGDGKPRTYYGASLSALARLGSARGYALVGRDSCGVNAFFVRRDLLSPPLVECDPDKLLDQPLWRFRMRQAEAGMPWVEIGPNGRPVS